MATATPVPVTVDIPGAVSALNTLGIFGVIAIGAVLFLASMLFRRFRR
jgi:hypothetical protein